MKTHKRIRNVPVSARRRTTLDNRDAPIGVRQQLVGDGHPRRTGAHDEIIRLQHIPHRIQGSQPHRDDASDFMSGRPVDDDL